jgi:AraC family L-rhamnose operon regulatory protein RhaS
MKRYTLHTPFSIYHFEADAWAHAVHKHTYYEIIFILRGSGQHFINGNAYPYSEGDIFLLGPEDFHHFHIDELTEFCFVRFNESIHKRQIHDKEESVITTLLGTSSQSRGSIVVNNEEKKKLHQLLIILESETGNDQSPHYELIRDSMMRTMLVILARNLFTDISPKPVVKRSVEAILLYIKQNIYRPDLLSIEHLAHTFNYSPAYISLFFKSQTGEPLKQYIIRHRIKLIEARLLYSQHTLTQIADEFGYTDESHLCKQFRKYNGSSPSAFRKRL